MYSDICLGQSGCNIYPVYEVLLFLHCSVKPVKRQLINKLLSDHDKTASDHSAIVQSTKMTPFFTCVLVFIDPSAPVFSLS